MVFGEGNEQDNYDAKSSYSSKSKTSKYFYYFLICNCIIIE